MEFKSNGTEQSSGYETEDIKLRTKTGREFSQMEIDMFKKMKTGDKVMAKIDGQPQEVEVISKDNINLQEDINKITVGIRSQADPDEFATKFDVSFEDIVDLGK